MFDPTAQRLKYAAVAFWPCMSIPNLILKKRSKKFVI